MIQLPAPTPSTQPAIQTISSLSLCLSPGQVFNHSAPVPPCPPPKCRPLLSCTRMRCSDVLSSTVRPSLFECVCVLRFTRKQLARGRQLLFPTACSSLGGQQQQDAVGERWLVDPAALGQSHHAGQGQVGSGLYCRCGLRGCWDLEAYVCLCRL